jgi:hypothetical protein
MRYLLDVLASMIDSVVCEIGSRLKAMDNFDLLIMSQCIIFLVAEMLVLTLGIVEYRTNGLPKPRHEHVLECELGQE